MASGNILVSEIGTVSKSHNSPIPYPTLSEFASEMCARFCYKMGHCAIFDNTFWDF